MRYVKRNDSLQLAIQQVLQRLDCQLRRMSGRLRQPANFFNQLGIPGRGHGYASREGRCRADGPPGFMPSRAHAMRPIRNKQLRDA